MTKKEFKIIKKASKLLDRLSDDETIKSVDDYYWSYLNQAHDALSMLIYHIKNNKEKLLKD